jgi:hypothetical protein
MTEKRFLGIIETNNLGRLIHRESCSIEYKENFSLGSINKYAKTMAAFANRKGGAIIFGVTDSPRIPKGMGNDNFNKADPEKISNFLNQNFNPEIIWTMDQFEYQKKLFGVVTISEAKYKPIIASNNSHNVIKEGDIYYRYSGRSERIKYSELRKILDNNKEKERKFWTNHIEKIASIGPENISLIDLKRGTIDIGSPEKLIIDREIIKKIKFIKEGKFVERDGAPTLKLIGDIDGVKTVAADIDLEKDFFTTKELATELNLLSDAGSTAYMTAVINHYNIKTKPDFFKQNRGQNLYSRNCYLFLKSKNIDIKTAKKYAKKSTIKQY